MQGCYCLTVEFIRGRHISERGEFVLSASSLVVLLAYAESTAKAGGGAVLDLCLPG